MLDFFAPFNTIPPCKRFLPFRRANARDPLSSRALDERYIQDVLSVMYTCGMYNYAGEWAYMVGLPAKSGVAGGIIAVVPGIMGIGVFSPLLDARGNSVRSIKVCEDLSRQFRLHVFDLGKDGSQFLAASTGRR